MLAHSSYGAPRTDSAHACPWRILARRLRIHTTVAVQWQRAGGGDWAAYAADVAARTARSPRSSG
jgi:hypothetical protein